MVESRKRVLLVEDDGPIAEILRLHLVDDGLLVEHAATGTDGLARAEQGGWDALILDLMLPGVDGLEICRRTRAMPGYTPIIIISARATEVHRILGLELGADDYVAKPFSPRELVARVRTILRRSQRGEAAENAADSKEKPTSARLDTAPTAIENEATRPTRHGPFELDAERRLIRYHGQRLDLARYEYGLLATLIQRPGRVFTRGELLARVWDERAESFDRTVDAHVKTLRAKLRAVRPGDDPIRTLRGVGYALNE